MVTLLQVAREVSSHTGRNSTVYFIAFDFEEWETGSEYTKTYVAIVIVTIIIIIIISSDPPNTAITTLTIVP